MDVENIRNRLRDAPYDFLSAVSSLSALQCFDSNWLSLRQDVDKAMQLSLLNDDDVSLAHAAATLLATSADLFWKTNDEAMKRTALFVDEMEDVFERLSISDVGHASRPTPPSTRHRAPSGSVPSYIPTAHSWILQNLHNPYPSSEIKERISQDAGRPLRIITDWFKDVRRHIGWVAICKTHFQGSRALAVQAAKRVYLRPNPISELSPDIVSQFEAIRTCLRDMYSVDDCGDLSDGSDDSVTPSSLSSRRVSFDKSPHAGTRSPSSTPSLVFSTDDEDSRSLVSFVFEEVPSLGKRKSFDEEDERPLKRQRSGYINVADSLVKDVANVSQATFATSSCDTTTRSPSLSLLQPIPSRKRRLSNAAAEWEDATPPSPSIQCASRPPLHVPKRRRSVSNAQPTPKCPCLPPIVAPRKQAVSAPIPIAHQATPDIDDWFRIFELPDTSLSVELFSNWDVTIENDVFPYDSLYDGSLQSDSQDPPSVTSLSDAYQSSTPLELNVSSAMDPSVLNISSSFAESPDPMAAVSPEPITATASPAFDFLDAFLSAVNAESAELHTTQSSSSPSTELSLNDPIDLFGELVVMP